MSKDLTVVLYTANKINNHFFENTKKYLVQAIGSLPLIVVSQKPIEKFKGYNGKYTNVCVGNIGQSQYNIYYQAFLGAKEAKTGSISLCEDDVLYSSHHFRYVPSKRVFAYDRNIWNIYTWTKPSVFSWKGRRNLNGLVCERELFIEAMHERFAKYNNDNYPKHLFGEPGKYERQLGVTVRDWEFYYTDEPSVVFSHPTELSYSGLGKRKRLGKNVCEELDPWGKAENVLKLYYDKKIN